MVSDKFFPDQMIETSNFSSIRQDLVGLFQLQVRSKANITVQRAFCLHFRNKIWLTARKKMVVVMGAGRMPRSSTLERTKASTPRNLILTKLITVNVVSISGMWAPPKAVVSSPNEAMRTLCEMPSLTLDP